MSFVRIRRPVPPLAMKELSRRYDKADKERARAWQAYADSGEADVNLYQKLVAACAKCANAAHRIRCKIDIERD